MHVFYYVSGHGFGHATRVCEVVHHLLAANHKVTIVSVAEPFIFQEVLVKGALHRKALVDAGGVIQDGPLKVDPKKTTDSVKEFMEQKRETIIQNEREILERERPSLILTDVAFAPLVAASQAKIPSAIISNFTWDYIYSEYMDEKVVSRITEDYACADLFLRLPGYVDIPAFMSRPEKIQDIPLVVRHSKVSKEVTRRELGISPKEKVILIQFGGHSSNTSWSSIKLPPNWKGILMGEDPKSLPPHFISVSRDCYVPDLVAASEVVLGKLGYGTCSEVIAANRPLIFVRRTFFNEQEGLHDLMKKYDLEVEISENDFFDGQWEEAILAAEKKRKAASKKKKERERREKENEFEGGKVAVEILEHHFSH